eukprot:scaffold113887_cov20-Tisochrysis_lutea.AAC.1
MHAYTLVHTSPSRYKAGWLHATEALKLHVDTESKRLRRTAGGAAIIAQLAAPMPISSFQWPMVLGEALRTVMKMKQKFSSRAASRKQEQAKGLCTATGYRCPSDLLRSTRKGRVYGDTRVQGFKAEPSVKGKVKAPSLPSSQPLPPKPGRSASADAQDAVPPTSAAAAAAANSCGDGTNGTTASADQRESTPGANAAKPASAGAAKQGE